MEKIHSKDGTLIAYQKSGEGPPLVLVHGTLATYSRWKPIIPTLAEHFSVYAMDRRGRGESGDTKPYALEREFEDIAALVDSIGEKVNLVGHSFGALCALGAALITSHVHKLIAYEPPPITIPKEAIDKIQDLLNAGDKEGAVITFVRDVVKMPSHELELWTTSPVFPERVAVAHTIPREFYAVEAFQIDPDRFKTLTVPIALFLGGDSPPVIKTTTEKWHTALPNSHVVVLAGQQHIAMDTAPKLFVDEIQTFLTKPH